MTEKQKIEQEAEKFYPSLSPGGTIHQITESHYIKKLRSVYIAGRSAAEKEIAELKEKEAIMFATWVENNGYVRFDKYYWTNDECETRLSDQQLYHKFKQLKQ